MFNNRRSLHVTCLMSAGYVDSRGSVAGHYFDHRLTSTGPAVMHNATFVPPTGYDVATCRPIVVTQRGMGLTDPLSRCNCARKRRWSTIRRMGFDWGAQISIGCHWLLASQCWRGYDAPYCGAPRKRRVTGDETPGHTGILLRVPHPP